MFQIGTLTECIRQFALMGIHAQLMCGKYEISVSVYADTLEESRKNARLLAWYTDKEDKVEHKHFEKNHNIDEFYSITLTKEYDDV